MIKKYEELIIRNQGNLKSRKFLIPKLDEPDLQDIAGEAEMNS